MQALSVWQEHICAQFTFASNDIIDVCFDYVTIVLGTDAHKNEILSSLKDELRPGVVEIIELKKLCKTAELKKQNFCSEFEHFVKDKANKKKKGCVIFDDLMSELSECGLLLDLFSKYSSHYDLTTIHITQNIFFKAGGKHGSRSCNNLPKHACTCFV